jgi:hypothetical protein
MLDVYSSHDVLESSGVESDFASAVRLLLHHQFNLFFKDGESLSLLLNDILFEVFDTLLHLSSDELSIFTKLDFVFNNVKKLTVLDSVEFHSSSEAFTAEFKESLVAISGIVCSDKSV